MNINTLKDKYTGKKVNSILTFKVNDKNKDNINKITKVEYSDIHSISIILFDTNETLAFIDYDCDGYRSGEWHLIDIQNLLDKGDTQGIKKINSTLRDIEYIEDNVGDGTETVLITTDDYLIRMGQSDVHDYYPQNFFDIDDFFDIDEAKKAIKGEVIKLKEAKQ